MEIIQYSEGSQLDPRSRPVKEQKEVPKGSKVSLVPQKAKLQFHVIRLHLLYVHKEHYYLQGFV